MTCGNFIGSFGTAANPNNGLRTMEERREEETRIGIEGTNPFERLVCEFSFSTLPTLVGTKVLIGVARWGGGGSG